MLEMDPAHDRVIKDILPPPMFNLTHKQLFPNEHIPDWKLLQSHLTKEGKLDKDDIIYLIELFKSIISKESNLVSMKDPITIVGDIHGQFYDLIKIFD